MKTFKISPSDHKTKPNIGFTKAELKRLFNALLIDHMSDDISSDAKEQLLQKLKYHITEPT